MKLVLMIFAALAAAQDLPPVTGKPVLPDFDAEIEKLLPDLGDRDIDTREKASTALRRFAERHEEYPALRAALAKRLELDDKEAAARIQDVHRSLPLFRVRFELIPKGAGKRDVLRATLRNVSGADQPYVALGQFLFWKSGVDFCFGYAASGPGIDYRYDTLPFYPLRGAPWHDPDDVLVLKPGEERSWETWLRDGEERLQGATVTLTLELKSPGRNGAEIFDWKGSLWQSRAGGGQPLGDFSWIKAQALVVPEAK